MSTIQDTTVGQDLTKADIDEIALKYGGVVGTVGGGYKKRKTPSPIHGYRFRWIGTHGNANMGTLIILAASKEASELLRQGKIQQWINTHGITYAEADSLYTATHAVNKGREPEVIKYCIQNRDAVHAWVHAPSHSRHERDRWEEDWGMADCKLSGPRWLAICAVMRAWLPLIT